MKSKENQPGNGQVSDLKLFITSLRRKRSPEDNYHDGVVFLRRAGQIEAKLIDRNLTDKCAGEYHMNAVVIYLFAEQRFKSAKRNEEAEHASRLFDIHLGKLEELSSKEN